MIKNIKNKFIKHTKKTFKDFVMTKSFAIWGGLSFALLFILCPGATIGSLLFSTFMGLAVCYILNFIATGIIGVGKKDTSENITKESYSASKKIYFQFNKDKINKNSKEREIFNNLK